MKKESLAESNPDALSSKKNLTREKIVTFAMNDPEFKVLDRYCTQYKISNRSRFIRESLMKFMLSRLVEEDYPTLFGEKEMR
jgi:hypothetical protein